MILWVRHFCSFLELIWEFWRREQLELKKRIFDGFRIMKKIRDVVCI